MSIYKNYRWCYIGNGNIAKSTSAQILRGNHKIVSVYGRNYDKAKAFAEKVGANAYSTAEEAINRDEVDAVYIATPHTSHEEYALLSIKYGKPVLCEKPVGVSEKDVETIINAAKENKVYFCEAMWTWFADIALKIKKVVKSGKIGEIEKVKINYGFPGLMMSENSRVRTPSTAGGALLDIGIYPITYCYNLFGMPNDIKCTGKIENGIDVEETVTLKYNKTICTLNMSLSKLQEDCVIYGTKGKIVIPVFHMASVAIVLGKGHLRFILGKTDYLNEFTKVSEEMTSGKTESDYIPFLATKNCMKIMDECRRQMNLVYPFEK